MRRESNFRTYIIKRTNTAEGQRTHNSHFRLVTLLRQDSIQGFERLFKTVCSVRVCANVSGPPQRLEVPEDLELELLVNSPV